MTIYLLIVFVLFGFSYLELNYPLSKELKKGMYIFSYLCLVLHVGLRWETGTDWNSYLDHFESINEFSDISPLSNGFELGYNLLVWGIKLITHKYSVFLLGHAIIFYFFLFSSLKLYSPFFFVALLIFYVETIGVMGSNRQLIAVIICLFSLRYILESKIIKFSALVFIAFNFHSTAFLFFIFLFLNRSVRPKYIVAFLFLCILIGKTTLPFVMFTTVGSLMGGEAATKVIVYISDAQAVIDEFKLSIFGLLKRLFLVFLFHYNARGLREKVPLYNLMVNGYTVGVGFYFFFSSTLLIMVSRGSLYFNIFEPILIASQFLLFQRKDNRAAVIIFLLVFSILTFFQSISSYVDLFLPYKGMFINEDFQREMR